MTVPVRPVSLNAERAGNRFARAASTADVRSWAKVCAREAMGPVHRMPLFDRVAIEIQPWAINRRYRQDIGACMPTAKAAIDGLVDAGVIQDDDDTHLVRLSFVPHQFAKDQIVLVVTPLAAGAAITLGLPAHP